MLWPLSWWPFYKRGLKVYFKIRMRRWTLPLLLMSVGVGITGCKSSNVVFVEVSDGLVRLGPDVRGHVYFWNGSAWELSNNSVDLPEGWYAGSMNGAEEVTE